jgi:glycosyltransferase involved in cell wall biosynthesis
VLGIGTSFKVEHWAAELAEQVEQSGAPVEVRRDLSFADAVALVGRAGVYLHTHGTDHPLGMPISIAEAMATGSVVVARQLPGMGDYVRDAGFLYDGLTVGDRADHAAAHIEATRHWDDERWASAWRTSVDRAWSIHPTDVVAADLLRTWRELLGVRPRPA